jgi:hypothetical protein
VPAASLFASGRWSRERTQEVTNGGRQVVQYGVKGHARVAGARCGVGMHKGSSLSVSGDGLGDCRERKDRNGLCGGGPWATRPNALNSRLVQVGPFMLVSSRLTD